MIVEANRFKCIGGCADGQWVKNHPRERQIKIYDRHLKPLPMMVDITAAETVTIIPSSIYRIEIFSVYDENEPKTWFVWVETNLSLAQATAMMVEGYREPIAERPE